MNNRKAEQATFGLEGLRTLRAEILRLAQMRGASNVRVFGSVVRGEAHGDSDVDFLVEMAPGRSLLDMGGLLVDLEELLGTRVDVVTEKSLRPHVREQALREAVPL